MRIWPNSTSKTICLTDLALSSSLLQRLRDPAEPLVDPGDLARQRFDPRPKRRVYHAGRCAALRTLNDRKLLALAQRCEQCQFEAMSGALDACRYCNLEFSSFRQQAWRGPDIIARRAIKLPLLHAIRLYCGSPAQGVLHNDARRRGLRSRLAPSPRGVALSLGPV
jgi:hypothetical protein